MVDAEQDVHETHSLLPRFLASLRTLTAVAREAARDGGPPERIFDQTLLSTVDVLPVAAAIIVVADGTHARITSSWGAVVDAPGAGAPEITGELAAVFAGRRITGGGPGAPPPLPGLPIDGSSWLALPLALVDGSPIACVLVYAAGAHYEPDHLELAGALIEQAGLAYDNVWRAAQIELLGTDELSSVATRRHALDRGRNLFATSLREATPLSAALVDIDRFRSVNDTHGHGTGDDVIREVAHRVAARCRPEDVVGRFGGEEYVVFLPGDPEEGQAVVEAFKDDVAATPLSTRTGPLPVTVSVGISQVRSSDAALDEVFARADAALYEAKHAGRNRVHVIR